MVITLLTSLGSLATRIYWTANISPDTDVYLPLRHNYLFGNKIAATHPPDAMIPYKRKDALINTYQTLIIKQSTCNKNSMLINQIDFVSIHQLDLKLGPAESIFCAVPFASNGRCSRYDRRKYLTRAMHLRHVNTIKPQWKRLLPIRIKNMYFNIIKPLDTLSPNTTLKVSMWQRLHPLPMYLSLLIDSFVWFC